MKVDLDALAKHPLAWVHRELPNSFSIWMTSGADVVSPRETTPAFYGCFDWHSAVHGHWTLARVARLAPESKSAAPAREALDRSLTAANVEVEAKNLERRPGFERPYGLAWLLTLAQELHEWDDGDARRWGKTLEPLERISSRRLVSFFEALTTPVRTGEHSQTAFALGLAIDWARSTKSDAEKSLVARARAFHERDRDAPLAREPSGTDFLSPTLAEADVMRRVLSPGDFARWLGAFYPNGIALVPAVSPNRADGRLAHLDGLNLSRAWMLEGIASGLPEDDARRADLARVSKIHAEAGLAALASAEDSLTHWIASFATYFVTRRGIRVVD
jgi:hypothetical protein